MQLKLSELLDECRKKDKIINILTENLTAVINNNKSKEFQKPAIGFNKTIDNDGWQTINDVRCTNNSQNKHHNELSNRFNGIHNEDSAITSDNYKGNISNTNVSTYNNKSDRNKTKTRIYVSEYPERNTIRMSLKNVVQNQSTRRRKLLS